MSPALFITGLSLILVGVALANFTSFQRMGLLKAEGLPVWRVPSTARAQIDQWRRLQQIKHEEAWRRTQLTHWLALAFMAPGVALMGVYVWRMVAAQ